MPKGIPQISRAVTIIKTIEGASGAKPETIPMTSEQYAAYLHEMKDLPPELNGSPVCNFISVLGVRIVITDAPHRTS